MREPYITVEPTLEPLTLAEAKLHCRIEVADTDRDALVTAAIKVARQRAEHITGRAIPLQTWQILLDCFPDAIQLPRSPVSSLTSVRYQDSAGAWQTLSNTTYKADLKRLVPYIVPAYTYTWPDVYPEINAVEVTWVAGYADGAVPESIKQYMRLVIADFMEHAKATNDVAVELKPHPFYERLLDPYTLLRV